MGKERRRPSWWQLWLLLPALGILAFLETTAPLSTAAHKIVEVGIVMVFYGLVSLWLRANKARLLRESRDGLAQTTAETAIFLPSAPGPIAGSNGNGHRETAWYVPTPEPDADDLTAREELDR
jgi:hypothetical protein